jgi:folate-binding protein YgfZ
MAANRADDDDVNAARAALRTGAALLTPLDRDVVVARGEDRVRFLHGVVTGNVAGTPVGRGSHALLLTPKAHVLAEMRIFVRAHDLYLLVPGGEGGRAAEALARYAVMDDFVAEPAPALRGLAVLGPEATARLAALGLPAQALAGQPPWSHADAGTLWLARAVQLGTPGFWVVGSEQEVNRLGDALTAAGTLPLSPSAAEAARIAAGEPRWGTEITDEYFPMEIGLGDAIDYKKGCFLGQEPIVRIRDRGHTNWRLARLELPPGAVAIAGDRLETAEKPKAGKLTSVSGPSGGVALGVVHVSVPAGTAVRVATAGGAVEAIVRDAAGAVDANP